MNKISLVSSGFGLSGKDLRGTHAYWLKRGVDLVRYSVERKKDLLCASDLESRLLELRRAFLDRETEIVWALRGGYGAQELLPFLKKSDFKLSKTYIGFSDCTSIHYFLNQNLGQPSLHGPHPNAFYSKLMSEKILNIYKSLLNNPNEYTYLFNGLKLLNKTEKKAVSASLVGGNLTTLVSILGTKFDKGAAGKILFLEEVEEPAYKINRMLVHLEQAGFLKSIKAVVFGHLTHSNKKEERLIQKVVARWALGQKFPVVSGLPAGHKHFQNHPLWLGKKSILKLDESPSLHNNI